MPRDLLTEIGRQPVDLLANEGLSWRQGSDPSILTRVLDLFSDPEKERARAVQALVDAEAFNIQPSDAYRYRDAIDLGVKLSKNAIAASRRTNIADRVSQSWETGKDQVVMGLYGADVVLNNDPAAMEKMLEVRARMPGPDEEYIPESKVEYAVRAAAKMSPMMLQIMKESLKKGLPVGMAAGGAMALLSMGPQGVAAPVTVPTATLIGFKAGATGAAFTEALKLEAGLAFSEFIDLEDDQGNKIDLNIARAAAFGVGAINAGIEVVQIKTLLKTIPGLDKMLGKAIMEAVTSKTLKDRLAGAAKVYAGTVAKETGQELAQESTNIVMEHVAAHVNNAIKGTDIDPASVEEIFDRLRETGKEAAAAFSVMALPGASLRVLPGGREKAQKAATGSPLSGDQAGAKGTVTIMETAPSGGPFILGVNEDASGEVTSFTMADPATGETFEVAAIRTEDRDKVRIVPDAEAVNRAMSEIEQADQMDAQIDRIIEGQEDIDQAAGELFGEEGQGDMAQAKSPVPVTYEIKERSASNISGEPAEKQDSLRPIADRPSSDINISPAENEAKLILDAVKDINDRLGEKGSIDLEPIVDLGRSLLAEGHQTLEAFTARAKELLADVWEKVKGLVAQAWNVLNNERGSFSMKPKGVKKSILHATGQVKLKDSLVPEYDALTAKLQREEKTARAFERKNNAELKKAFKEAARKAREAYQAGKADVLEEAKEKMRWVARRRDSIRNIRDYFSLTDSDLRSISRKNPVLMGDSEFHQWKQEVEQKAVELAETTHEKMALLKLIEDRRLKKVDNYRRTLQLPTFNDMTAEQLRDFARLLEPFQDDDVFLTQRELETVDRTDLRGIRTWREARERLAKEAGVDVEELNKVRVGQLDSFLWDTALRERDPFFNVLVTDMTTAMLGAQLRAHDIQSQVYALARKAEKSRKRGVVARLIPQDDLIMAFLESPADQKADIAKQMTPEQIDYANFIQQYFAEALNYLIVTKGLDRGRENYFVHIRRSFLENLKDGGLKSAISKLFKNYQQDQMVFNILDDDTGNILPLEKFFQFSLQRTDVMEPTRNVTKAFLTYMRTFEKKKMFDAIIPKLDIYAQSLTPTRYTPRGLEIDRSLKTFVNKWINNKKGRRLSFDSTLRQGGPLDVGIRALRTFTTILDLGLSPIVQTAAFLGEQVTNAAMLGNKAMAVGTARMRTEKGKQILKKYEAWVGRSLWEEFTAPGKEIAERLSEMLFGGFHLSTVSANKQFLLASLTEQEWESGEISTERLAELRLDMGRFRVVSGVGSLVGSTSAGDAVMQYKKWAAPFVRTLMVDAQTLVSDLKKKSLGEALTSREAKELYRFAYLSMAVFTVGAMAGADDDDRSVIGKAKARMYMESMTLMQGIDPALWLATPRTLTWLYQTAAALKNLVLMEEYKTGERAGELKGNDQLKRQFVPGVVRSLRKNP